MNGAAIKSAVENFGFADGSVRLAEIPSSAGLIAMGTTSVQLTQSTTIAALTVTQDAGVYIAPGGDKVLKITPANLPALNLAGTVDLADNDAIVQAANPADRDALLAAISVLIKNARNSGAWDGAGITSSVAKADATALTGLAAIANNEGLSAINTSFAGQTVDANSILIKYTFNGDADVNGKLNASDYFLIDRGFLSKNSPTPLTGYRNGDFDYNGLINASDYFLIDKAFLDQNKHVPPAPLAAAAAPKASVFSAKKIAGAKMTSRVAARRPRAAGAAVTRRGKH